MIEEFLKLLGTQGIWASLSIVLIFYILKQQEKRDDIQSKREENYQLTIIRLTQQLESIASIQNDVNMIKQYISS